MVVGGFEVEARLIGIKIAISVQVLNGCERLQRLTLDRRVLMLLELKGSFYILFL
jgi:hypothetical protein